MSWAELKGDYSAVKYVLHTINIYKGSSVHLYPPVLSQTVTVAVAGSPALIFSHPAGGLTTTLNFSLASPGVSRMVGTEKLAVVLRIVMFLLTPV